MTDEDKGNEQEQNKQDDSSGKGDKNAMKAFYRAMYAGAEPDPDDYGITVDKEDPGSESGPRGGANTAEMEHLQMQLEEMEKRCLEAENLYKRMAADFENYRKRTLKEKEEFAALGIQQAIEAILPALDDMDLAVTKLTEDMKPKSIIESLNMVYKRFAKCLEQIGIKQLDVIGEQFDPRFHEPVQQVVDNNVPEGSIVYQLRPGYQFNDKILRPSLVNVATGGSEPEESDSAAANETQEEVEEVIEEIIEEEVVEEEVSEGAQEEEIIEEIIEEEVVEEEAQETNAEEKKSKSAPKQEKFRNTETQDIPADKIKEKLEEVAKEEAKSSEKE